LAVVQRQSVGPHLLCIKCPFGLHDVRRKEVKEVQVKDSVPHEIVLLAPGAGLIEGELVSQERDE
jgi:hypothetical protein